MSVSYILTTVVSFFLSAFMQILFFFFYPKKYHHISWPLSSFKYIYFFWLLSFLQEKVILSLFLHLLFVPHFSIIWFLPPPYIWNSFGKILQGLSNHLFMSYLLNLYNRPFSPQTLVLGVRWDIIFCFHIVFILFSSSVPIFHPELSHVLVSSGIYPDYSIRYSSGPIEFTPFVFPKLRNLLPSISILPL